MGVKLLAAAACVVLAAASCAEERGLGAGVVPTSTLSADTTDPDPTVAPTSPSTSTTAPIVEPVRIVVAGDSIAYDLEPAVDAALPDDLAVVDWFAAPTTFGENLPAIAGRLDQSPVDVVVMLVGVWERGAKPNGLRLEDVGFAEAYRATMLEALRAAVAARGAELILLRPPTFRIDTAERQVSVLAQSWKALAEARPDDVRLLDTGPWLRAGAGYHELTTDKFGGPERLVQTDGLHLCPEGAARIAHGLVVALSAAHPSLREAVADSSWWHGSWTSSLPVNECPTPRYPTG